MLLGHRRPFWGCGPLVVFSTVDFTGFVVCFKFFDARGEGRFAIFLRWKTLSLRNFPPGTWAAAVCSACFLRLISILRIPDSSPGPRRDGLLLLRRRPFFPLTRRFFPLLIEPLSGPLFFGSPQAQPLSRLHAQKRSESFPPPSPLPPDRRVFVFLILDGRSFVP